MVFIGDSLSSSHFLTHSVTQSHFLKIVLLFHTISYHPLLAHTIPYHFLPSHNISHDTIKYTTIIVPFILSNTISYHPITFPIIIWNLLPSHSLSILSNTIFYDHITFPTIPAQPIPFCDILFQAIPFPCPPLHIPYNLMCLILSCAILTFLCNKSNLLIRDRKKETREFLIILFFFSGLHLLSLEFSFFLKSS